MSLKKLFLPLIALPILHAMEEDKALNYDDLLDKEVPQEIIFTMKPYAATKTFGELVIVKRNDEVFRTA